MSEDFWYRGPHFVKGNGWSAGFRRAIFGTSLVIEYEMMQMGDPLRLELPLNSSQARELQRILGVMIEAEKLPPGQLAPGVVQRDDGLQIHTITYAVPKTEKDPDS